MADSLDALVAALRARTSRRVVDPSRAAAAVALILVANPDRLLLIRRAERVGDPWSGHLALPGGRRDAGDASLLDTAIRETLEEVGVSLTAAQCEADLDDVVPSTPERAPIMVRPFVFNLAAEPPTGLSEEVAQTAWVTLETLAAHGTHGEWDVLVRGERRQMPGYRLEQGFLWGMTERIVRPVVDLWRATTAGGDRLA